MPTITEVRQKYPQYDDLSDDQLAGALHQKFYSDVPVEEFRAKIGLTSIPRLGDAMQALPDAQPQGGSFLDPLIGQGVMAGFGDEAKAGVRGAARRVFGNNPGKSLGDLYGEELGAARADLGEFQQRHPVLSPTLEIGGAVATAPFIPGGAAARGANLLQRTARGAAAGTGQAAVYGAGTAEGGIADRALGAAQAAPYGLVGGAAAPLVVRGVQAGGRALRDYAAAPVARQMRGAFRTEQEAARRIGEAAAADRGIVQPRLMPGDLPTARRHGSPVYNIDLGGEKVRALAQSAGNTSPEGRAILKQAIGDRFETQGDRTEGALRQIVGGTSAFATREALEQQAAKANRGSYKWAYKTGDRPIWSRTLEHLTSSSSVKKAMQSAAERGNDRAVAEGFSGFNPGVSVDPSGIIKFRRGPAGIPAYPNIQYWDYVQRELRDAANAARRRGENEQAGALTGLHQSLNKELDKLVPDFGRARQGAARFFNADSALEAGQKFMKAGTTMTPAETQAAMKKMSAAERQLFAEGAADEISARVGKRGDTQNVINQLFKSPDMRRRVEVAMGPARARELEAFLHTERMLDQARQSVSGFSTTARQQFELGMAGGLTGLGSGTVAGYSTGDWRIGAAAAISGALLRRQGLRVNQDVARRVAEMLVSPDPAVMRRGVQAVANNDKWMEALRRADLPVAMGATRATTGQSAPLP